MKRRYITKLTFSAFVASVLLMGQNRHNSKERSVSNHTRNTSSVMFGNSCPNSSSNSFRFNLNKETNNAASGSSSVRSNSSNRRRFAKTNNAVSRSKRSAVNRPNSAKIKAVSRKFGKTSVRTISVVLNSKDASRSNAAVNSSSKTIEIMIGEISAIRITNDKLTAAETISGKTTAIATTIVTVSDGSKRKATESKR